MCVQNQAKGQDLFFHTTGINNLVPILRLPSPQCNKAGICKDQGIADLPNLIHDHSHQEMDHSIRTKSICTASLWQVKMEAK